MGYWCTLHLFDVEKFCSELVPELKGEKGDLFEIYKEFLAFHRTGGTAKLSDENINKLVNEHLNNIYSISNSLDNSFKINSDFEAIKDYYEQIKFIGSLDGHYDFCRFFEYYIFKSCADFFPHIALGKGGVGRNFNLETKSLSYSIIGELDHWKEFISHDSMGITNWLNSDEIELLYLDIENLHFEDNERSEGIVELIKLAHKNNLSLISGVDMREEILERLPQNKLLSQEIWEHTNQTGMLFKR